MLKIGLSAALVLSLAGFAHAQNTPAAPAPAPKPVEKQPDAKPDAKPEKKAETTLMVGDKAPAPTIEKWIKGEPVTGFEKGKVYVVEFWATWCGPCIAGMPHLTKVQKEYKDKGLTIIGVTSKDDRGNTLEKAEQMVKDKGDAVMGYTVAWDTERKTNEAFRKAAKKTFIPCAFIVDRDGMVAWIGNPNAKEEGFDATLEQVITGKHDLKAAAAKYRGEKPDEAANSLEADFKNIVQLQNDEKWDDAIAGIDKLLGKSQQLDTRLVIAKFNILLVGKKDTKKAYAYAGELADKYKTDPMVLNGVAWGIVDPEAPVDVRDTDLALRIATDAVKVSEEKDGAILDTLARCHWLKGDKAKAIEIQKKAVAVATPEFKKQIEAVLKEYEKGAAK